jgi:hypothetical protein
MMCRLYLDEVGNDDVSTPTERFLSITGITTKISSHENYITPEIESLKADLFGHSLPDNAVILHRREIVRREGHFTVLREKAVNESWESRILDLIGSLPYIVNTVLIDKHEHVRRYAVWHYNPYHYCMRAIVERYVLWLRRHKRQGDVVVEPRDKNTDKKLKASFQYIYNHGTEHIPAAIVQAHLTSHEIKFSPKPSNVCGLQLVDLLANPSHQALKCKLLGEQMTASFGSRIVAILEQSRYARHPQTRVINGWGQKLLP